MREKKEINVKIGEQVKSARENAKLTQEQLAERIDVSTQYISDLERGIVGISVQTLKSLCNVLCVKSDTILFGENENSNAIMLERFKNLSKEQIIILSEIIDKYVEAIALERERKNREPKH